MNTVTAFTAMLASIHHGDVSRRQLTSVIQWRDLAVAAERHAKDNGHTPRLAHLDSSTHKGWRAAAEAIVADLLKQMNRADRRAVNWAIRAENMAETARTAVEQAEAHTRAAAKAAASLDPAAAKAHHAKAAEFLAIADTATVEARRAEGATRAAGAWFRAAADAHATGARLITDEDARAVPVGQAQAAAGGRREVPDDKRYYVTEGAAA